MAETVYDEETRLPELLDRVEQGEEVTIARHGAPVAKLVPLQPKPPKRDEQAIREALRRMDELSKRVSLGGLKIKDLINEGRK
jgi:prevent-host-death family protein